MTVPSLVSSCARAASAKEAAFRIDYPLAPARATRVIGFDARAAEVVRSAAGHELEPGAVLRGHGSRS